MLDECRLPQVPETPRSNNFDYVFQADREAARASNMHDVSPIMPASAVNDTYDTALGAATPVASQEVAFNEDSPSFANIPKPPAFVSMGAGGKLSIVSPSRRGGRPVAGAVAGVEPSDYGFGGGSK